ncbi:MAG: InlB B-repeat-containing protein [Nitrososphaerales archaeon]
MLSTYYSGQMKRNIVLSIFALIIIFGSTLSTISYAAYNGANNDWIGDNSSPTPICSDVNNPVSTLTFSATMKTNITSGYQWSTQMNSWPPPGNNSGVDWMQYNMAVDSSGDVYGSVEYWTLHGGSVWDSGHQYIYYSYGTINPGDEFETKVQTDSNHNVNKVAFMLYDNAKKTWYHSSTVNIPINHNNVDLLVPLVTWQMNIVGENSGSNPTATFTSGLGRIAYASSDSIGTTWSATRPSTSCITAVGPIGTGENSNMTYGTPYIETNAGVNYVEQDFYLDQVYYLTMIPATGGSVTPASGWYNPSQNVQIQAYYSCPPGQSGYLFTGWSGSGSGSYTGGNNPDTITMNGDITERASAHHYVSCPSIPSG